MARTQYLAAKARSRSKLLKQRMAKRARSDSSAMVSTRTPVITHGWPRGPITAEFKSHDFPVDGDVDAAAEIILLNGTARGADIDNRIGRMIVVKSIQIAWSSYAVGVTGIDQTHRFLIVYDKQTNGVLPAIGDILTSSTPWAQRNLNNRNRFIILHDSWASIANDIAAGAPSGLPKIADFKYYRRHNLKTQYNAGDTGLIGDIATGGIYFIKLGSVAAGVTAGLCIGNCRIRFIDS